MEIILTKTAIKSMKRLDAVTRNRVLAAINKLPFGDVKKLKGMDSHFRLRVGNLRVLYIVDNDRILIDNVLPRGEAYKNL